MQGTVKWFNLQKGFGFITDSEGKEHFVHQSSIIMKGFRHLNEDDIVNFELGTDNKGREQAVDVTPFLTMKMVKDSLKEESLQIKRIKDADKVTKYLVVDANNAIQTSENGISFLELAAFSGFDIKGLEA